jgi:hypothetical protein
MRMKTTSASSVTDFGGIVAGGCIALLALLLSIGASSIAEKPTDQTHGQVAVATAAPQQTHAVRFASGSANGFVPAR